MGEFNSDSVTISKLFSQDFFFQIPDYQRPFSWDADNLDDLVTDLDEAPRQSNYFLGTLILHSTGRSSYDVVDGQQRLTSLCILLACIRDSENLAEDPDVRDQIQGMLHQKAASLSGVPARSRLHVKDLEVFNKVVIQQNGTRNTAEIENLIGNGAQKNRTAVKTFRRRLDPMTRQKIVELAQFIAQRCTVIYLAAPSFDDAFRLFTVINDRGKQLRRIDILKAENLSPTQIPTPAERTHYAKKWEALEEEVGSQTFEDIFHSLRLIFVKDKPKGDLLAEFNDRVFNATATDIPARGAEFLETLSEYVAIYDSLFIAVDYLEGDELDSKFRTLMNAMTAYFGANEWRACVLYFAKRFGKGGLYAFLQDVEKVFLDQWVDGIRKDERYASYTRILKAIARSSTGSEVMAELVYDIDKIREACLVSNFYTQAYSKYLLVRAEILAGEIENPRYYTARSVEHVLPQNPATGSSWNAAFSPDELAELVHTAGNLVLLSKSKNSTASNKEFVDKKTSYLAPRVSEFPRSISVLAYDSWTPQIIRDRTRQFAETVLNDF